MKDRKRLHLARASDAPAKPPGPSLALIRQALKLFRGRNISKAVRHLNARKWLIARMSIGERHILNRTTAAAWGMPGVPGAGVSQVFAARTRRLWVK